MLKMRKNEVEKHSFKGMQTLVWASTNLSGGVTYCAQKWQ